ncbi:hypothetical protein [Vibrio alginolyticus]|uniref:hypothetical protein n=1 Tax=Vibrio alginolyticus TaxID=663 RepID=UPI001B821462|nr:hypothetical protein [Vibrio alginolyticus]MBS9989650.1 hypothetical protein [Vibrio alginolyticus]HBC3974114.1 hypothetical protein [Vibrio alginolyticus]
MRQIFLDPKRHSICCQFVLLNSLVDAWTAMPKTAQRDALVTLKPLPNNIT